ncbi:putative reverse transcriptase domain-containing protein [Tanacetum coccineum]
MVPNEEDKVERFVGGLPDNIQGNVIAAEPTKLQDAIRVANNLMDQKLKGYARSAENKRRLDNNTRDNHRQQSVFKRQNVTNNLMDQKLKGYARSVENKRRGQNVARAYTAGNNERKGYVRSLPHCSKCKIHHAGPCIVRCGNCKRVGHMTRDCKVIVTPNTQRAPVGNQHGIVCYECGRPRHFRKDYPKLRNQNRGNKTGNKNANKTQNHTRGNEATTRAYAIGGGETNPDSNVVTGTFLLNNCYASMLFDSGTDRSFVSSTFSALLDVAPSTLDTSYAVELADGRISETNIVLRGCTLGLLGHPFDIDLMPVELGSFDVIIGDDCDGKSKSKLNIISCTKTQKYMEKGCQVYLAQVTSMKNKDKSEEKRLEDVMQNLEGAKSDDIHVFMNVEGKCEIGVVVSFGDKERGLKPAIVAVSRYRRLCRKSVKYANIVTTHSTTSQFGLFSPILLEISKQIGQLEILSHEFKQSLGGIDFDAILKNPFAHELIRDYEFDVDESASGPARLRASCEKLKIKPSAQNKVGFSLKRFIEDINITCVMRRDKFHQLTSQLLQRVTDLCSKALNVMCWCCMLGYFSFVKTLF